MRDLAVGAGRLTVQILAAGAHPDDIEIGAGALVSRLAARGHDIWLLILTDDGVTGWMRRSESAAAAKILGAPEGRVLFGGLRDGYLRADGDTVTLVRRLTAGIDPGLIITHTAADSHNDHAEADRITRAAFRRRVFWHYSVALSAEPSMFCPSVWLDVSDDEGRIKAAALAEHVTQRARLARMDLAGYEARMGARNGCGRVEAFEVTVQEGADPGAVSQL